MIDSSETQSFLSRLLSGVICCVFGALIGLVFSESGTPYLAYVLPPISFVLGYIFGKTIISIAIKIFSSILGSPGI